MAALLTDAARTELATRLVVDRGRAMDEVLQLHVEALTANDPARSFRLYRLARGLSEAAGFADLVADSQREMNRVRALFEAGPEAAAWCPRTTDGQHAFYGPRSPDVCAACGVAKRSL